MFGDLRTSVVDGVNGKTLPHVNYATKWPPGRGMLDLLEYGHSVVIYHLLFFILGGDFALVIGGGKRKNMFQLGARSMQGRGTMCSLTHNFGG